jgi:3',5'-nucleoside bisphosphate phosphatase
MPRGDPFTALCRLTASLSRRVAADLHLHTTASDGDFTPSQVVAFARVARLDAIAVTDHDTLAGVGAAVEAADGTGVRVIPGVELTTEWDGHEVHLLGYFPNGTPTTKLDRLTELCDRRRERFRDFIRLIRDGGTRLDDGLVTAVEQNSASLGRRHVASLLMRSGIAPTRREVWQRFVGPLGRRVIPKLQMPFDEATEWVRSNGGLSSLAHPSPDLSESTLAAMKEAGLGGVEVKFPAAGVGRRAELNRWSCAFGLIVTGGSDCHGGEAVGRSVGAVGVTAEELRAVCETPVRET